MSVPSRSGAPHDPGLGLSHCSGRAIRTLQGHLLLHSCLVMLPCCPVDHAQSAVLGVHTNSVFRAQSGGRTQPTTPPKRCGIYHQEAAADAIAPRPNVSQRHDLVKMD